jgi:hypothetical protein
MKIIMNAIYALGHNILALLPKRKTPSVYSRCLAVHVHYTTHFGALNSNR